MLDKRTVFVALVLLFAGSSLLAGCASSGGGATAFSYGGTWTGSMIDSYAGAGTTTLTISQSGTNIVGTWQAAFTGMNNGGTLAGVINGNEVLVELYPSDPSSCPFAVVAQRSGATMAGTYAAFDCTVVITGTVSVTKQ